MKKIWNRTHRICLLALFLLGLCLSPYSFAGDKNKTDWQSHCKKYVKIIERIRGKTFKQAVTVTTQTTVEFRAFVDASLDKELSNDKAMAVQRCLKMFALIPQDSDLEKLYKDLIVSQAAAYYDPAKKRFVMLGIFGEGKHVNGVIVHELEHALQDQYFNIGAKIQAESHKDSDTATAYRSLVEGEATLVQMIYQLEEQLGGALLDKDMLDMYLPITINLIANLDQEGMVAMGKLSAAMMGDDAANILAAMDALGKTPNYLYRNLTMPYGQGAAFVTTVFSSKGWDGVDQLFKKPPVSTEQILHPEKYLDPAQYDAPEKIMWPQADLLANAGWSKLCEDGLGELSISVMFEDDSNLKANYLSYAAGWDGDSFRLYQKGEQYTLLWRTVWDSEAEAKEFFGGYQKRLQSKLQTDAQDSKGNIVTLSKAGKALVSMRQLGNKVIVVEGPASQLNQELLRTFK